MLAAGYGHFKCVEVLLKDGAKLNHRRENGETALLRAARTRDERCVRQLLRAAADCEADRARTAVMAFVESAVRECATTSIADTTRSWSGSRPNPGGPPRMVHRDAALVRSKVVRGLERR